MQGLYYVRCLLGVKDLYPLQDAVHMIMKTKTHSLTFKMAIFGLWPVCNVIKGW